MIIKNNANKKSLSETRIQQTVELMQKSYTGTIYKLLQCGFINRIIKHVNKNN